MTSLYARTARRRRRGASDRGASTVENAAMLLVIAAIVTSLVGSHIPAVVSDGTQGAICRVFATAGCDRPGQSGAGNGSPVAGPNGGRAARPGGGPAAGGRTAASPGSPPGTSSPGSSGPARPGARAGQGGPATSVPAGGGLGGLARGFGAAVADTGAGLGNFFGFVGRVAWASIKGHASGQYNQFKAAADDAAGIWDLITNPAEAAEGLAYAVEHPWEAAKAMAWDEESRAMYARGDFGGAFGRAAWNIGSFAIPGPGWAAKVGKLGKLARLGRLGKAGKAGAKAGKAGKAASPPVRPKQPARRGAVGCGTPNSFVPGTAVLLADGSYRAIEEVDVGDRVWAADPLTGRTGPRPVVELITGAGRKHLVEVTVDADGRAGGPAATLTATAEHPFWLAGSRAWVDATDLRPGDALSTPSGTVATVIGISRHTRVRRVHNLTVADLHTYYVAAGGAGVLVHNAGCPKGLKGASDGLKGIFDGGSVRGKSINQLRAGLLRSGFTQGLAKNKKGYLFQNAAGEQVRIMRRNGGWDIRIRNKFGNYLDEHGNVANPNATHDIGVESY